MKGRVTRRHAVAVDAGLWLSRGPDANARLRADARGRDGGVREELAAGVVQLKPTTEVEATSILPPEREDCTIVAWYRSLYAPRTGGAYDSHHRTAGIAGRTRRRGGGVAARGARAAGGDAGDRVPQ